MIFPPTFLDGLHNATGYSKAVLVYSGEHGDDNEFVVVPYAIVFCDLFEIAVISLSLEEVLKGMFGGQPEIAHLASLVSFENIMLHRKHAMFDFFDDG